MSTVCVPNQIGIGIGIGIGINILVPGATTIAYREILGRRTAPPFLTRAFTR